MIKKKVPTKWYCIRISEKNFKRLQLMREEGETPNRTIIRLLDYWNKLRKKGVEHE